MPIGKEVGAFTSSVTSMTKSTDAAGNHVFVINVEGIGSGAFGTQGTHQWQLNGIAVISEGSRVATEGTLELANRSYNGKMFAIT